MPSTPYDLVKDDQDLRIPLHAEQAFFHGITFQAKFIGWDEVPRPNTRAEIVQAMRRIRYECKVQNMKKRKVTIHISVNGVRVCLKKKKRRKKQWTNDADDIELMHHPIYRIFYVSHDSSDLKIFSYIARDGSTDTFKCSVFKSNKKSQAMRIVRTVGQAFEVCHKFNLQKNSLDNNEERSDLSSSEILDQDRISEQLSDDEIPKKELIPVTPDLNSQQQRPNHLEIVPQTNRKSSPCSEGGDKSPGSPISTTKEIHQLKDQLEQQSLQTRQALAQLMLVREQLISETNARIEAQARTQQLLQQNRELLEHLASLGGYTEANQSGLTQASIALAPQSPLQLLSQELPSPMRKAFLSSASTGNNNNNNLAAISQQLNNLGSINQQLSTLSHQLSGLNQQSQNLQNFQNLNNLTSTTTPISGSGNSTTGACGNNNSSSSGRITSFPTLNQLQNFNNKLSNLAAAIPTSSSPPTSSVPGTAGMNDILSQNDLFQVNQELLNRLQSLNLGLNNGNCNISNNANMNNNNNTSPYNSYFFSNPGNTISSSGGSPNSLNSSSNNNNNMNNNNNSNISNSGFNFLSSPNSLGNLTPSPIGTLNRSSYSGSPLTSQDLQLSIDKNLNCSSMLDDNNGHFIKPLSQVGTLTTLDSDGKVKVIVPVSSSMNGNYCELNYDNRQDFTSTSSSSSSPSRKNSDQKLIASKSSNNNNNNSNTNSSNSMTTVTLKVTDESGNVTNSKRLSATPSFITRSTSEKVPNRSQMMSEVQKARAWARHTTK